MLTAKQSGLTPRQIEWAKSHDWFHSEIGYGRILVEERSTWPLDKQREALDYCEKHSCFPYEIERTKENRIYVLVHRIYDDFNLLRADAGY